MASGVAGGEFAAGAGWDVDLACVPRLGVGAWALGLAELVGRRLVANVAERAIGESEGAEGCEGEGENGLLGCHC